jgi:Ser/Thr protein kinase RdoA (MazF antagonist)
MVWLSALRCDTGLGLPEPLPARNGSLVITVQVPGVPEPRHCALFTWLPGPDLAGRLNTENVYKLGQYSARLHEHAKTFSPPDDFRLRKLDRVFPYSDPDFSYVEPVLIFNDGFCDLFPPRRLEIFRRVVDRIQSALDDLYADPGELRVIHNDLHQWNVKVYRGEMYALDFEDLIWGYPIQDIATTLYYYQGYSNWKDLFEAFRQGYTSQSEWPEAYPGQMETFMAGRGIMLVNYLLCSSEAEDQEMAPEFIARVERRLLAFMDKV